MLDRLIRAVVNLFYLVPFQVRRFRQRHPEEQVLIADAVKARQLQSGAPPQYELGWVMARRGVLILTSSGLFCGDWRIPLEEIETANLQLISSGAVLSVTTRDGWHYQFGMQRNPEWQAQSILPLQVERRALKFSSASLVLRLGIAAWLGYILMQDYAQSGWNFNTGFYAALLLWLIVPIVNWILNQNLSFLR
jgi:hypothetical protein